MPQNGDLFFLIVTAMVLLFHPTIRSKFPNFTIFPDSDSFELNIF